MIQFRVLGGIDLRDASGKLLDDLLRQPKRVALLLYLALAESSGLSRRDTLLALFWPDLDDARARAALRKSLYFLRGALGSDVIVSRGDDEVGVDAGQLDCDAGHFTAALADGRLLEALELYRGDLAAGLHVSDVAPEFEQWLDDRRSDLRRRAADAAWKQSVVAAEAGDAGEAVRWARWASDRAPEDEVGVRRLLELLTGMGDHAGAIKVYEGFRSRLRAEYQAEPSPETRALIAELGSRTSRSTPLVSGAVAEAPAPVTALREAAPAPLKARRAWIVVALAVVTAIVLALALRPSSPRLDPDLVAVAPFRVLSPGFEVWGEGMADLLSRNLDGAGPLRTVPPTRVVELTREGPSGAGEASRLGRSVGAGLVVYGALIGVGRDSVRLTASVLDLSSGRAVDDIEIGGAADHMNLVVDSVTRQLLRAMGTVRQIGSARLTGIGSSSVPALKAFLRGEQFRRRMSWDSAQVFYEAATDLDSSFAMAWLRLGEAQAVSQFPVPLVSGPGPDHPWRLILRAGQFNRGLGRHDSLVVDVAAGIAAFVLGQVPPGEAEKRAARVYGTALEAVRLYPEDAESWFGVAVVQDFLGDVLNTTNAQTYASYARATALDTGFAPAYRAALRISGDAGDIEGTRRLAARFLILNPSPASRAFPALIAGLLDPATDTATAQRLVDSAESTVLWPVLTAIWLLPDSQEAALRVAREMAKREADSRYWFTTGWITRRNLAAVLAYRGHLRASLALGTPEQSTWFPNLFPELAVWGAVPAALADSAFAGWRALPGDTLGLDFARWWWAARGNVAVLSALPRHTPPRSLFDDAFLALARRDTSDALRQFIAWHRPGGSDYFALLAMVRLMVARGDAPGALTVLNGREPNDWPIPSHVVWTLERARLSELAGQRDAAVRDYRFVAEVWRHADPSLQPYVAEARAAVRRLERKAAPEEGPVRARIGAPGVAVTVRP